MIVAANPSEFVRDTSNRRSDGRVFGSTLVLSLGPRADQHGGNICVVAAFMEVVKVQGVVNDLIYVLG